MKWWAIIISMGAVALSGFAQTATPSDDDPGKGVARVSVISGEVSVKRGDSGDLIAAAVNAPLVETDRLLTGPESRAEIQFDYANMIRLGPETEVRMSQLENRRYQIQVAVGTATFRVLRESDADVEISTPSVSVRPTQRGTYRVTVRDDGSSEITVRSGEVDIFTPRGSERLSAGQTMMARGSASDPEYQVVSAIAADDFDRWNEARDRDLESSRSYQYVARDIYGAEDLDGHGRWVDVAGYGNVWSPTVAAGWAPYRDGRWSWVDYYGWSWVSYDPWGWAPYHYGRWLYEPSYGWCWWPGAIQQRYHWRPALVAFFGWGSYGGYRSGIGFGYGNVGWVPLAPYETYYPWYGRGWYGGRNAAFLNHSTIVNNYNIGNSYRNARYANGITAINSDAFGRRHITNADLVRVNGNDLSRAGLVRGILPVTPGRESLRLSDRNVLASVLPRTADDRRFVTRQVMPRGTDRVSFEQQRSAVEQVARRSFTGTSSGPVGNDSGWRRVGAQAQSSGPSSRGESSRSESSWRRFGEPASRSGGQQPAVRENSNSQRFGEPNGRTSSPGGQQPAARDNSNYQRFGEPSGRTASPGGQQPAVRDNSNYQRFGEPSGRTASPSMGSPRDSRPSNFQSPVRESPQFQRQTESPRSEQRFSEPVRINPPIVRERPSSPSFENRQPSYRGGGGGGSPQVQSRGGDGSAGGGGGGSRSGGGRSRGR